MSQHHSFDQTARFDPAMCHTPQLQSAYQKACRGSETCVKNMQTFCTNEIHTNKEFNVQVDLLNCHIQCQDDKACRKQCVHKF